MYDAGFTVEATACRGSKDQCCSDLHSVSKPIEELSLSDLPMDHPVDQIAIGDRVRRFGQQVEVLQLFVRSIKLVQGARCGLDIMLLRAISSFLFSATILLGGLER
jgi:hypothetical protein